MATKHVEHHNFLIEIYFVLGSLLGLILIVMGSVNVSKLVLNQLLGVKPYPEFTAPYPVRDPVAMTAEDDIAVTQEQKEKLKLWEKEYDQWQALQKDYNSADQARRREIATAVAMLIVGVPVFAFHVPYVLKRK